MYIRKLEDEIKNKTVIVTGGNKGIGRGCAEAFCVYGANVVIVGRDEKAGRSTEKELTENTAGKCVFSRCDVSSEKDIMALIDFTVKRFGGIDVLVNNAGYLPNRRPLDLCELSDMEDVFRTNFFAMFCTCKHALPYLRASKGSIINMSSVLATTGQEGSCLYASTKGAIVSFSKSIAIDEARNGVRVNVVSPGDIETELNDAEVLTNGKYKVPSPNIGACFQWIERSGHAGEIGGVSGALCSSCVSWASGVSPW